VFNYVDLVGAILLILVVPLRMLDLPAQWGVYSAGYLLSVLKIFQYSAIFRWEYVMLYAPEQDLL